KSLTRNPAVARHWTALLRGRKLRLPWRMASGNRQPLKRARLMPVREREHGELPSPICPGLTARLDRDLLFSKILLVLEKIRGRGRGRIKRGRIKRLARKFLFAKISERAAKPNNQIKLWDASTTTSSRPSATRRWSN